MSTGVRNAIYELGKECDVATQDIRNNLNSIDEACACLASRIREKISLDLSLNSAENSQKGDLDESN